MLREKRYYVYILSSKGRVLYVGMTGFLAARVLQHKAGETDGFTRRYHVDRLVYCEVFRYVNNAITRETEIKGWRREKKVALIEADNPLWNDLAADWGQPVFMNPADSSRDEAPLRNDKLQPLAVLAVQQVAHGPSASFVGFRHTFAFVGVYTALGCGFSLFRFAAFRAAVGEAGLIRFQFELLRAHGADSDRECHANTMIRRAVGSGQTA